MSSVYGTVFVHSIEEPPSLEGELAERVVPVHLAASRSADDVDYVRDAVMRDPGTLQYVAAKCMGMLSAGRRL